MHHRMPLRYTAVTAIFAFFVSYQGLSYAIRVASNNGRSATEGAALAGLPVLQTDDQSTLENGESYQPNFLPPGKDEVPSFILDFAGGRSGGSARLGASELPINTHEQPGHSAEDSAEGQTVPIEDIPTLREDVAGWDVSVDHFILRKPRQDLTQYAAFRLHDIQLDGLAAYDKQQPVGAFALSVGCGYFHDPVEVPGVAHMVEHMIFLGSKSQRGATEWDEFVGSNGGSHNAHTKPDMTTFYVQAPSTSIPELLDAFLDHIFNPLFLQEHFETEVMAVQYEHEKNIPDVERASLLLAMRHLPERAPDSSNRGSTLSGKFGTGNLESLCIDPQKNNIDILATLRAFHQKCYRPENMSISIRLGRPDVAGSTNSVQEAIHVVETAFRKYVSKATSDENTHTTFLELPHAHEKWGRLRHEGFSEEIDSHSLGLTTHEEDTPEVETGVEGVHELSHGTGSTTDEDQASRSSQTNLPTSEQASPPVVNQKTASAGEKPDAPNSNSEGVLNDAKSHGTMIRMKRQSGWHDQAFIMWGMPVSLDSTLLETEFCSFSIINFLLDHPSGNGLIERLKDEGLINGAELFRHSTTRSYVWGLSLDLTQRGASQFGLVKTTVNNYIVKMKDAVSYDFIEKFYETFGPLSRLLWNFEDPLSPLDQVVVTAEKLLQFPMRPDLLLIEDVVLSDPPIHILWREVTNTLNAMTPGKEVTVRVDPNTSFSYENFESLKEYNVEFIVENPPDVPDSVPVVDVPTSISCSIPSESVKPYPPPSVCFSMNPAESIVTSQGGQRVTGVATMPPCVLLSDESLTLLWHNGAPFNKPVVRAFVKSRIPANAATALTDVFGKAFSSILGHRARKRLARFHGCGVEIVIAYTAGALVVELESLSPMFPTIISDLGDVYEDTLSSVSELEFTRAIEKLRAQMGDFSGSTSYEIAMDVALSFIRQSRYSQFDLRQQLEASDVTFQNFVDFLQNDMTVNAVDMFTMGHIDASDARRIMMDFAQQISKKSVAYERAAGTKILNISSDIVISIPNPIPSDVSNAYVSLLVSEPPDALEAVVYQMIGELIGAPFFDAVRTRKMDGYVASASVIDIPPVVALGTIVQSSTRTPDELEQHVCSFLYDMMRNVGKLMTLSDFYQRARWISKTKFARASNSFAAYFSGVVSQLSMRNFCFVLPELAAIASDHFLHCPSSIQEYLQRLLMRETRHKVTVKLTASKSVAEVVTPSVQTCKLRDGTHGTTLDLDHPQGGRSTRISAPEEDSGASETPKKPKNPKTTIESSSSRRPDSSAGSFVEVSSGRRISLRSKTSVVSSVSFVDTPSPSDPEGDTETVAASSDVPTGLESREVAIGESVESRQYCQNDASSVTSSSAFVSKTFAEGPTEERARLLKFLSETISRRSVKEFWIAYDHEEHCTIRERSIETANACVENVGPSVEDREVPQDSEWLKPRTAVSEDEVQPHAVAESEQQVQIQKSQPASSGVGERSLTPHSALPSKGLSEGSVQMEIRQRDAQNLQRKLLEHQRQQAEVVLRLQSQSANGMDSQVQELPLGAQRNSAGTTGGNGKARDSLRQQQGLIFPRLLVQRRYGMTPSLVMAQLSSKQATGVSGGGRMARAVRSMHDAERMRGLLQLEAYKLRLLKERHEALDKQIADVMELGVPLPTSDAATEPRI